MPYKKITAVFSLFNKSYPEKRKKTPIFVHRGLRYADKKFKFASKFFFGKCLVAYKICFEVEKKRTHFWGNFNFTFFKKKIKNCMKVL